MFRVLVVQSSCKLVVSFSFFFQAISCIRDVLTIVTKFLGCGTGLGNVVPYLWGVFTFYKAGTKMSPCSCDRSTFPGRGTLPSTPVFCDYGPDCHSSTPLKDAFMDCILYFFYIKKSVIRHTIIGYEWKRIWHGKSVDWLNRGTEVYNI